MRIALLSLLTVVAGCRTIDASVADFTVAPLPAFVAEKVAQPLYLVVSGADVPDDAHVELPPPAIYPEPVDLAHVRTFVTRDLRRALEPYFSSVHVLADASLLPKTPHVRAQIKIVKIEYEQRISAGEKHDKHDYYAAMEWAFALRASSQPDYVFRFAERTLSATEPRWSDDTAEFRDMFEQALRHLVGAYDQSGAQAKLIALAQPARSAAN